MHRIRKKKHQGKAIKRVSGLIGGSSVPAAAGLGAAGAAVALVVASGFISATRGRRD